MKNTLKELQAITNVNNLIEVIPNQDNIKACNVDGYAIPISVKDSGEQIKFNVADMIKANKTDGGLYGVFGGTNLHEKLREMSLKWGAPRQTKTIMAECNFPDAVYIEKDTICVVDCHKSHNCLDLCIVMYSLPNTAKEFFSYWDKHKRTKKLLRNAECYVSLIKSQDYGVRSIRGARGDKEWTLFEVDRNAIDSERFDNLMRDEVGKTRGVPKGYLETFLDSEVYQHLKNVTIPLLDAQTKWGGGSLTVNLSCRQLDTFSFSSPNAPKLQGIVTCRDQVDMTYSIASALLAKKRGNSWNPNTYTRTSKDVSIIYKHLNNSLVVFSPVSQIWRVESQITKIKEDRWGVLSEAEKGVTDKTFSMFGMDTAKMDSFTKRHLEPILLDESVGIMSSDIYKHILSLKEEGTLPLTISSKIEDLVLARKRLVDLHTNQYMIVFVNAGYTASGDNEYNVFPFFESAGDGKLLTGSKYFYNLVEEESVKDTTVNPVTVKYFKYSDSDIPDILALPLSVLNNIEENARIVKDLGVKQENSNFVLIYEVEEEQA